MCTLGVDRTLMHKHSAHLGWTSITNVGRWATWRKPDAVGNQTGARHKCMKGNRRSLETSKDKTALLSWCSRKTVSSGRACRSTPYIRCRAHQLVSHCRWRWWPMETKCLWSSTQVQLCLWSSRWCAGSCDQTSRCIVHFDVTLTLNWNGFSLICLQSGCFCWWLQELIRVFRQRLAGTHHAELERDTPCPIRCSGECAQSPLASIRGGPRDFDRVPSKDLCRCKYQASLLQSHNTAIHNENHGARRTGLPD